MVAHPHPPALPLPESGKVQGFKPEAHPQILKDNAVRFAGARASAYGHHLIPPAELGGIEASVGQRQQ
jgi:hypothetical protein